MTHQEFSSLLQQSMQEICADGEIDVEVLLGGTGLTLALIMKEAECESMTIGNLTLTLTESNDEQ